MIWKRRLSVYEFIALSSLHWVQGRSIWIEEREKRKYISGIYLFRFKMFIQEEIRLNITIIWHNKPSKGRIFEYKRQKVIFISSIFKQGSYELINIYFLFQGLIKKFIVTKICHQVPRLSLRKGRISYCFFCLPLFNYYLDILRWNNNNNAFVIGAFTEAEIQVRIDEPSAESYHYHSMEEKSSAEVR